MSLRTKKGFKKISKVIAGVLFALLMFTNIKIGLMDDAELASSEFTILGFNVSFFVPSYAKQYTGGFDWSAHTSSCDDTDMGRLCDFECNIRSTPHCSEGETGQGYI